MKTNKELLQRFRCKIMLTWTLTADLEEGKTWLDLGCILKVDFTALADGFEVGFKRKGCQG